MRYTAYGRAIAERPPQTSDTGATAHMRACGYDTGKSILLTGHDVTGRAFRLTARSVYGAHMVAKAAWGVERAWHVREDGSRKLVFTT